MPSESGSETNNEDKHEAQHAPGLQIGADAEEPTPPITRWINFWERIKSRTLMHWLAGYAGAAYVLLHAVQMFSEQFHWNPKVGENLAAGLFLFAGFVLIGAWYQGERSMKHIGGAEWALLLVWTVISASTMYWGVNKEHPGSLKGRSFVVLAVMSGAEPYEKIILDAFRKHAQEKIASEGGTLDWKPQIDGYAIAPESPAGKEKWKNVTDDIRIRYEKTKVHYLLGVGTFASTALKNADLASDMKADGLLFLGITDPVGAHLVESLKFRNENTNIAVVQYGSGGQAYGEYIASLFPPGQKLVFVKQRSGHPQDEYMARELRRTGRIGVLSYDGQLNPKSLSDPDAIYFAWYGFDNVLNDPGRSGAQLLKLRVVPSTCTQENVDNAGIVVSVDDTAVGKAGAEMMWRAIQNLEKLGERDVRQVDFQVWINRKTVHEKGIKLKRQGRFSGEQNTCPK